VKLKRKKRRYNLADIGNGKKVRIPVIEHLPYDPEWEKVEEAFALDAYRKLPPRPDGYFADAYPRPQRAPRSESGDGQSEAAAKAAAAMIQQLFARRRSSSPRRATLAPG